MKKVLFINFDLQIVRYKNKLTKAEQEVAKKSLNKARKKRYPQDPNKDRQYMTKLSNLVINTKMNIEEISKELGISLRRTTNLLKSDSKLEKKYKRVKGRGTKERTNFEDHTYVFQIQTELEKDPMISQRKLSEKLGISRRKLVRIMNDMIK
jgi:hypothetical protein